MKNILKEKLENGGKAVGTFFETGISSAVECLGIAGLDFLIIDTEHGPFSTESTADFIRAAELRKISPFVRVKDSSRSSILRMLDIGAQALIIPCIYTVEEVEQIIEYGKYSPKGSRGFFYGRAASYGYDVAAEDIMTYFEACNRKTMLLPQCETSGALENIEKIVSLDGVDGIFIGPYDLSIGMGIPGSFNDPLFIKAVSRVLKACIDAGKYSFIFAADTKTAKKYLDDGFTGAAVGTDVNIYINAYRKILKDMNS